MKKYVSIQLSFLLNMQIDIRKFFCLQRLAFQQECVEGDSCTQKIIQEAKWRNDARILAGVYPSPGALDVLHPCSCEPPV